MGGNYDVSPKWNRSIISDILFSQAVKAGFQPTSEWGPALHENKTGKYAPKMDLAMTGSAKPEVVK